MWLNQAHIAVLLKLHIFSNVKSFHVFFFTMIMQFLVRIKSLLFYKTEIVGKEVSLQNLTRLSKN